MTFVPSRSSRAGLLAIALALAGCVGGASASPSAVPPIPSTTPGSSASAGAYGGAGSASAAPSGSIIAPGSPTASGSPAASAAAACPTTAPAPWTAADTATVTMKTAKGTIVIKVDGGVAPNATANFVVLVDCGFYNGVVFHRLVPGFVIQGGDGQYGREPNVDTPNFGLGGPGYTIPDDGVFSSYPRGTVAMARTPDPHSAGSQFFIVLDDGASQSLASAGTYAIIGHVTSGMDAVDAIAAMPNSGGQDNIALQPVPIDSAKVSRP